MSEVSVIGGAVGAGVDCLKRLHSSWEVAEISKSRPARRAMKIAEEALKEGRMAGWIDGEPDRRADGSIVGPRVKVCIDSIRVLRGYRRTKRTNERTKERTKE